MILIVFERIWVVWQCKLRGVKQGEGILCSCCQKKVNFTQYFHSVLEVLMVGLINYTI